MSQSGPNPGQRLSLFDRPLPPGYRDELKARIAERPADPARRAGSSLLFLLGDLRLALPVRVASAVAPVLHIARVPNRSGTVLLGLVAFRGDILPCCSLARLLEVSQEPAQKQSNTARTLILEESPGRLWAVPIDGVLGVREASYQASEEAAPLAAKWQWLRGSFYDDAGQEKSSIYHLLDHEVLFRQINLATA
jgi:chemotaxis-related protein WspD